MTELSIDIGISEADRDEITNELALAVDLIAERIRSLGAPAPASYRAFSELSSIPEGDSMPDATEMIRRLVAGQEAVARTARSIFPIVENAHDEPTADLLTQRRPREDGVDAAQPARMTPNDNSPTAEPATRLRPR